MILDGCRLLPALWLANLLLFCWPGTAHAERNDWAEGVPGREDGATRDYYNRAGLLRWNHHMGDWRDAAEASQGDEPYAVASITRDDIGRYVQWDATRLVREWADGKCPNQGFFLRRVQGQGEFHFGSREQDRTGQRPQLLIETGRQTGRQTLTLAPEADTYLEPSTYRCMGNRPVLKVGGRNHSLLRFDLSGLAQTAQVEKASLRAYVTAAYGTGGATIGLFRCSQGHDLPASEPILGLAAQYPQDRGIGNDPDVIFVADFESDRWDAFWTHVANRKAIDTVDTDPAGKFRPLLGKALRVRIAEGSTGALNTIYKFAQEVGSEPREIYFRYYLRLADDWNQTVQGGKMPGVSGTYGKAGWGGRRSDGTNGWSARGAFHLSIPKGNPLEGLHPLGTYCYHADMEGRYGNTWLWQNDYRGFLENNRWYSIEQYLKLNTPGEKDGVLRAWVDGRLAFEKSDIRFRLVDKLKIEQIWMNVYHGGTRPSPYDQHLYIDNVVIASKYIGPMRRSE